MLLKTLESRKFLAQKFLTKSSLKWGIYNPYKKLAVGCCQGQNWPSGRPAGRPANDQIFDRWAYRSPAQSTGPESREQRLSGRSTARSIGAGRKSRTLCRSTSRSSGAFSREQSSLDGRPARSTGPPAQAGVHACARRSTGPSAMVDRSGRPAVSQSSLYTT